MTEETTADLLPAFALLSKSAARKKIYSLKALKEGRKDAALLLRAIADSETAQARRLLSLARGTIDNSDRFLATIFAGEIPDVCAAYRTLADKAQDSEMASLVFSLTQLHDAEKSSIRFYDEDSCDIAVGAASRYYVCQFCGYIEADQPPENCPICGAQQKAFKEINE